MLDITPERQAKALRHLEAAERAARTLPGWTAPKAPPVRRVGVVGAGTMGAGIAASLLNADFDVVLLDVDAAGLARGQKAVAAIFQRSVERGRLTAEQAQARTSRLEATQDWARFADADLVIEAVFEGMALKKEVFAKLETVCRPDALLATNTSSLDVDEIAAATEHPERVLGLHFFSPANVMPLVEIVRAAKTSDAALAAAFAVTEAIGKVGVVSRVGFGFIGNRMLQPYGREAQRLLLEGASPAQVDGALEAFGMAMGPLAVADLAGIDVGVRVRAEQPNPPSDPSFFLPARLMFDRGRYGQKTGAGFYRYDPATRARTPDAEVDAVLAEAAAALGIERRTVSDEEIRERCLFALINEGAQLLEEGIALRASDVDVVWTRGYGFPKARGGPMFYADTIGLRTVAERVRAYGWRLAPLLERLAAEGSAFEAWDQRNPLP
ncbi:3-hydroxyacyl-CoA dehydrogenase [Caulobacter sp. 17J80-11]|uniref:3-hydroxyacyl-CoA dehydrogenase n=1 Tax=Caulobacter sp. 17J80-11 TaxID=2763502 RepID=UPI0016534318|nr:3-hydroxyacyl-CoA dehydrogenase [Caulobacter sp. 17J80-11]MBC6981149.1 hypothetical protein [Caulobacter sp. 17J80-11]